MLIYIYQSIQDGNIYDSESVLKHQQFMHRIWAEVKICEDFAFGPVLSLSFRVDDFIIPKRNKNP